MELNSIITLINTKLAGELLTYEDLKVHMDSVIDDINDRLNATFPAFSEFNASDFSQYPNYNLFPDRYVRSVVVPGAAFKWLITDEEGAESAPTYEADYLNALFIMQRDYSNSIPSEYQAEYTGYLLDTAGTCSCCGCSAGSCTCLSEPSDYFPSVRYVDRFATGADWDGIHLTQGNYHFWVDSNGDYRYKYGDPTDEFDGSVIGGLDTSAYDAALVDLQTDQTALDARVTSIEGGGPAGGFPYVQLDTTPAEVPTAVGAVYYDETDETVAIRMSTDVTQSVGEELYLPKALNNTGATITNGKIVRISGASGNKATMALVDGTVYASAHTTIAMATEDVANNTQGRFTTQGIVRGLNTSAYADGAELWLDPTSANGDYTDTEPTGAQAYVKIGRVFKSHVSDGWIYFDVHHVPHVDELANADVTSVADGDVLMYDLASSTWKNKPSADTVKFTPEGGLAIQMINKTGAVSVKGTLVSAHTVDNSVALQTNEFDTMGVIYNSGVADGSNVWVVVSGIAELLLKDGTASTAANWVVAADTDGRADASQPTPTPNNTLGEHTLHFKEVGHCIETKSSGTDVLAKCVIHFN